MPPVATSSRKILVIILTVLFLAALGTAGYFYYQNTLLVKNASTNSQVEADKVITAVGKLLILPENEKPTVATVSDPKALKDQPFFVQAEIGDKVLIYTNAKQAILYRPSINKIIAVSPIIFQSQNNASVVSTTTIQR